MNVGDGVVVSVGVRVGVRVGVLVGVRVGVRVGMRVNVAVGRGSRSRVGGRDVNVMKTLWVGVTVGVSVGGIVGVSEGVPVGVGVGIKAVISTTVRATAVLMGFEKAESTTSCGWMAAASEAWGLVRARAATIQNRLNPKAPAVRTVSGPEYSRIFTRISLYKIFSSCFVGYVVKFEPDYLCSGLVDLIIPRIRLERSESQPCSLFNHRKMYGQGCCNVSQCTSDESFNRLRTTPLY